MLEVCYFVWFWVRKICAFYNRLMYFGVHDDVGRVGFMITIRIHNHGMHVCGL